MKRLDWYIIRKYLSTFFFVLLLFTFLSIIIDFSEKVDNILGNNLKPIPLIKEYFLNFALHIGMLIGNLFLLVAVIFFTAQLAGRSEIVAMNSGGVSFYRLLVPYLVSALLVASMFYYFNHNVVPKANRVRQHYEMVEMRNSRLVLKQNLHRQIEENMFVYIEQYKAADSSGFKFSIEEFTDGVLTYKLNANSFYWNKEKELWTLQNYYERYFEEDKEEFVRGREKDTLINLTPEDLEIRVNNKDEMPTKELNQYIVELEEAGADGIQFYKYEKHRRSANAFSIIVLTVIGFSIASKKVRGGMGLHLAAGVILGALYELIGKFSWTYTTNAGLDAFWGAWIPNFIFCGIAAILVLNAQK